MFNIIIDFISVPAFLISMVAMLGLILQKKAFTEVVSGTIKTAMGFIILGGGATLLINSLTPLGTILESGLNIKGIVPNNEAIVSLAIKDYGVVTSLIMVFAMCFNIIIARFSPLKYIFLTGHHIFYMASMIGVILMVKNFSLVASVLIGSIILGGVMTILPALAQPFMVKITGNNNIALGHFNTFGYVISGFVGKLFKSKSTEELSLPKNLTFLKDSTISISITMSIIYVVISLMVGKEFVETNLSHGQNFIIYSILQGLLFSASVYIIMQGVRLLLAEITQSFIGISKKLVPNAIPALDCPIVFPYAPNATLVGFIFSTLGGLVGLYLLTTLSVIYGELAIVLVLPSVIAHYFTGATAGVFGNSSGGRLGAIVGAFSNGFIITFLPLFLLSALGSLGFESTTYSDSDFAVIGIILSNILSLFN